MTKTETSSLPTLEKIIETDMFDSTFKRRKLIGNIIACTVGTGFGAALMYISINGIIRNGIDTNYIATGYFGSIVAICSIGGAVTGIRKRDDIDYNEIKEEKKYYYVKGKMSKNINASEQYGTPVEVVSNLAELEYASNVFEFPQPYRFIDHLFIESVSANTSLKTREVASPPEPCTTKTVEYAGTIQIRRNDKRLSLPYVFITSIDSKFSEFMSMAGNEFALLYKPGDHNAESDQHYPFTVEKIYYPHP